jgi:arylsulfatase A-like enzyme
MLWPGSCNAGRHRWLGLLGCCLLALPGTVHAIKGTPINIILILADDVGAETIGSYGGESYQTPQLDRLAADGMRFEHGHAQPLCTPSRVKLMTGKYNFRNYRHFGVLDAGEKTFATLLRDAGYATTVIGKWQLFNNRFESVEGALPADAGFDSYLLWQLRNEERGSRYWGPLLNHDGELRQHPDSVFGPDVFNEQVLDFIDRHTTEPFLIYYPMVLAHDPWVTTPDMRDAGAGDQQKFAAMMAYMDKLVGNVRRKVEQAGLAERTLILFIGDNGTGREIVSRHLGNDVRGAKGKTITAGSRVPFLAWGPGIVAPGGVSGSLVNLNDVLPTLAEFAGIDLPQQQAVDGDSLAAVLRGESELQRDSLFIHYEPFWPTGAPARYAFDRRWKLYEDGRFYDMQEDPLEKHALSGASLQGPAAAAHRLLTARLENMPGELQSTRRWFPRQFYWAGAAALLVVLGIGWLGWRLLRALLRRKAAGPRGR